MQIIVKPNSAVWSFESLEIIFEIYLQTSFLCCQDLMANTKILKRTKAVNFNETSAVVVIVAQTSRVNCDDGSGRCLSHRRSALALKEEKNIKNEKSAEAQ